MNEKFDIVIAGAGVTGLTIAALLAQGSHSKRLRLTVIDASERPPDAPDDDFELRVSAIATGSVSLLQRIGAWQAVSARASAFDSMRVWDESSTASSSDALRFDAAEFAVPQLGFIVENQRLQKAVLGVLERGNVDLVFATAIESMRAADAGYELTLADGRTRHADLVIGADGAHSFVRQSAGIVVHEWPYAQTAFVTHLRPQQAHRRIAWQRFLRDGPLGLLPLQDGRVSLVWTTTPARAEWAAVADADELGRALSDASDHVLGALTVAGPRGVFPLTARHAGEYVKAGVALIGDAAHAVHPLAGQGANLGLQDALALAEVLAAALDNGEHPGDRPVLRRYERARKGANAAMLHFMTGLNRLFATDSAVLKELRTTGMHLFNRSGPVREHVVRVALGSKS